METKIDWKTFRRDVSRLADKIKPHNNFTKIVCITKGGLIPAYYLAHLLGIKYIETLCISSYSGKIRRKCKVIPETKKVDIRHHWLIVDDLLDSGGTLKLAKKYYPNSKIATVYRKPKSPKNVVDFCEKEIDAWIVFPWEL